MNRLLKILTLGFFPKSKKRTIGYELDQWLVDVLDAFEQLIVENEQHNISVGSVPTLYHVTIPLETYARFREVASEPVIDALTQYIFAVTDGKTKTLPGAYMGKPLTVLNHMGDLTFIYQLIGDVQESKQDCSQVLFAFAQRLTEQAREQQPEITR